MTSGIVFTDVTRAELEERIRQHEASVKALGVTFQELRDLDWSGWMTDEEPSLFGDWVRDRFLLGISRNE